MATALNLFQTLLRKLTASEVDQNFINLRTNLDKLGGYTASQTPAAGQIPVLSPSGALSLGKFTYPIVTIQKTPADYNNASSPVYETFQASSGDFLGLGAVTGLLMSIGGNYATYGFQEATVILSAASGFGGFRRFRRAAASATTWGAWTSADIAASAPAGIAFPATQVASSDPNTLDDYEKGTFTPAVFGGTSGGVGTYSAQYGKYTKMGNRVDIKFHITWSAHTGTGPFRISGLPFASLNDAMDASLSIGYFHNIATNANSVPTAIIPANSLATSLYQYPSGGGVMSTVPIDTAGEIEISGTYFV